jgi:hypothetical protein
MFYIYINFQRSMQWYFANSDQYQNPYNFFLFFFIKKWMGILNILIGFYEKFEQIVEIEKN